MSGPRCPGQDMRFWTADAVSEVRCPHCGHEVEFFKDEPVRTCRSCRKQVRNPNLDLACAEWCSYAAQCLAQMPADPQAAGSLCDRIIDRMKSHFDGDHRRISHALAVLQYAERIMASGKDVSGLVVRAAAILHDVGIPQAERKHGSSAGKYQELEGPPVARKILEELKIAPAAVDHVCRIIANGHSPRDIDTPEFRIVWDADWLASIPEQYDTADKAHMLELIEKVFRTDGGKRIAQRLFLERKES